jgi:DNA-binding transcriptional ArsR family regulator
MGAMSERQAKDSLFAAFAEVAKALANGRRAEIVDVLAQGERSVEEIAGEIGQTVANTSHHLQALVRGGLLTTTAKARASSTPSAATVSASCGRRCAMSRPSMSRVSTGSLTRISAIATASSRSPVTSWSRGCAVAMSS